MSNPETDLKAAIIEAVNATGRAVVWNSPAGSVPARRGWIHMAPKGTPDILGFMLDGRLLAIEVKTPKGTTDKARAELQQAWRDRAAAAGCVVGVARSVEDAVKIVTEAGRRAA